MTAPGWDDRNGRLERRFQFPDFLSAMAFVNRMATVAEAAGHHPDFAVHYNVVDVTIWTHDLGERGLTAKDYALARQVDALQR